MSDTIKVKYVDFEEVQKWPRNPKDHDLQEIKKSFTRFGFTYPILVDEGTGKLIAGHGRLETLALMKEQGQNPPARVRVLKNGKWMVPVLSGIKFANEAEAEAYLLADNRLTEIGGWNKDQLSEILQEMQDVGGLLDGTGFDEADVMDIVGKDYDYSEIEDHYNELTGSSEMSLTIIFPKRYKDQVDAWLKNGESGSATARGRGILKRMGITLDENSTN
jgi:hypothetical protein